MSSPVAEGVRQDWRHTPSALRSAVEALLGAPVAEAATQRGGFSPGVAARVRLADGRRGFVKAVSAETNDQSVAMHRRELRNAALLPPATPAPRLLGSYDDGVWVALVFEDVEGRQPRVPWEQGEARRVLGAVTGLSRALTPAPGGVAPPPDELFQDWRRLAAGEEDPAGLGPWVEGHLEELAAREAEWTAAAAGDTLVHGDLRADNMLLTDGGEDGEDGDPGVVFVDWPHAMLGAAWLDLLFMLPCMTMQGGPDPEETFTSHPLGRDANPGSVTNVLAGITGMFVCHARRPAPPGLPTLREFQRAQGEAALAWLSRRL